jgi:hypothetical protein
MVKIEPTFSASTTSADEAFALALSRHGDWTKHIETVAKCPDGGLKKA